MRSISLALLFWLVKSASSQCPTNWPPEVQKLLANSPGWVVVDVPLLNSYDRDTWHRERQGLCPGFAEGHYRSRQQMSYAVSLIKATGSTGFMQRVLLLSPGDDKLPLLEVCKDYGPIDEPTVLWTASPQKIDKSYAGRDLLIDLDSFVIEKIDAWAKLYYFKKDKLHYVVTSN